MNSISILGIIPARGGSKGVPGKNIIDVCGRPLISYSIETGNRLVDSGVLKRCVVTTDSAEIADVAKQYNADVPFIRPGELASDTSKSIDYIYHALDSLETDLVKYWAVMILQPTSPIRDYAAIKTAVENFQRSDADSLISCYEEDYINDLVMYTSGKNGRLTPKHIMHNKGVRRQEHGSTYVRNGAVYLTRVEYLRNSKQIVCDNHVLMKMRKVDSIDIDTHDDLKLLRAVLCK